MRAPVTVLVTTIPGREDVLADALASIDRQRSVECERLVIPDTERMGNAWAKNVGLAAVRTEWVAFLDDDDFYLEDHLATLLFEAEAGGDLIYSRPFILSDPEPWRPWPDIPFDPDRLRQANYIPAGYMVRAELARSVGGFVPRSAEMPYSDWGFLLRLLDAGAEFRYVPEVTWAFRRWEGNTVSWGRDREVLA